MGTLHIRDDAGQGIPALAADVAARVKRFCQSLGNIRAADLQALTLPIVQGVGSTVEVANLDAPPYRTNGQAYTVYADAPAQPTVGFIVLALPPTARGYVIVDECRIDHTSGTGGLVGRGQTGITGITAGAGQTALVTPLERAPVLRSAGAILIEKPVGYDLVPPIAVDVGLNAGALTIANDFDPLDFYLAGITDLIGARGLLIRPGDGMVIANQTANEPLRAIIRCRFVDVSTQLEQVHT